MQASIICNHLHITQEWTVHLLQCVHSLNVEYRHMSMFGGVYRLTHIHTYTNKQTHIHIFTNIQCMCVWWYKCKIWFIYIFAQYLQEVIAWCTSVTLMTTLCIQFIHIWLWFYSGLEWQCNSRSQKQMLRWVNLCQHDVNVLHCASKLLSMFPKHLINLGAASPNYSSFPFTMSHIHSKSLEYPAFMNSTRNVTFDPTTDRTLRAASVKSLRDFHFVHNVSRSL